LDAKHKDRSASGRRPKRLAIVTISRQQCSFGNEIAETLSRKLGWEVLTRDRILSDILSKVATPSELYMLSESPAFYHTTTREGIRFIDHLRNELTRMTATRSAILVGFGSQFLFCGQENVTRIRVQAPMDVRIERLTKQYHVTESEAATILRTSDRKQHRFLSAVYDIRNLADPTHYDLVLNTARSTVDEAAAAALAMITAREANRTLLEQAGSQQARNNHTSLIAFKNPEEIEFAQILDTYHIDWVYEPKTFPIEWDIDGNVKLAFTPDFYLPKLDLYLELTIMNQKYVSRKNRKAKKLRELYPGINVRIVYKKDFQSLIERFSEFGG
jgi:cytidylate kinase